MAHHLMWFGGSRTTTWRRYFRARTRSFVTSAEREAADERAQHRFGAVQSAIRHDKEKE